MPAPPREIAAANTVGHCTHPIGGGYLRDRRGRHDRHKVMQDHVPKADGFAVARLRTAGAVILGKLATHEFAFGGPSFDLPWPPARNPWDTGRFTGGSSSGTGASVAAGLVLGGTGSDTGGSIRGPAAYCGIAGIKPTYGLVSRMGVLPLAFSLDHAGPMAWNAEDCAIMLQAMAGHDPADPASATDPDYRGRSGNIKGCASAVAISRQPGQPATRDAIDAAANSGEEWAPRCVRSRCRRSPSGLPAAC